MINKRGFLVGAASTIAASPALAASTATARGPAGGQAADGRPLLHGCPGQAAWGAYLGQPFRISDGQRNWTVLLDSVQPAAATAAQPVTTEQFVLGFVQPDGRPLPEGLHGLRHANGQGALLQLNAGGPARLRAEFSLLRDSA